MTNEEWERLKAMVFVQVEPWSSDDWHNCCPGIGLWLVNNTFDDNGVSLNVQSDMRMLRPNTPFDVAWNWLCKLITINPDEREPGTANIFEVRAEYMHHGRVVFDDWLSHNPEYQGDRDGV